MVRLFTWGDFSRILVEATLPVYTVSWVSLQGRDNSKKVNKARLVYAKNLGKH